MSTLFIRNVSFDTEQAELQQFMEENFGPLEYCLLCEDKQTGTPKGTAFAKFKNEDDYQKCLEEFRDKDKRTKFNFDDRNLIVLPALSRDQTAALKTTKKKEDKRNICLLTESDIAPEDVPKGDLEKRKELDLRKKESLKNLHKFVADKRLCIHNLPATVDDAKLKKICLMQGVTRKITECRVMRNKNKAGKLGRSKGFAFVSFDNHEDALKVLKALNNNEKIFSKDHRPIVEFSIENQIALKKKKDRLAKSRLKVQPKHKK